MGITRDTNGTNRLSAGTTDGGQFAAETLGEAISKRGNLADIGRIAENLSEQIRDYDRTEARLNLTEMRRNTAYRAYLDAAADHDRNTLRAIGDWAGAEHPDAKTFRVTADGLFIQGANGAGTHAPYELSDQLSDNFRQILGSNEDTTIPVEVLRNIEWITDEEIIEVDLGDTTDLPDFQNEVFSRVELTRDNDGSLALTYEAPLDLAGILSQQGHRLGGLSAEEYAYEHEVELTRVVRERYGLEITNAGDESAAIGGWVADESWTEATAEQISGLLYSSEMVRFYNESDNGTHGSENLSRILFDAVDQLAATRTTPAAA